MLDVSRALPDGAVVVVTVLSCGAVADALLVLCVDVLETAAFSAVAVHALSVIHNSAVRSAFVSFLIVHSFRISIWNM